MPQNAQLFVLKMIFTGNITMFSDKGVYRYTDSCGRKHKGTHGACILAGPDPTWGPSVLRSSFLLASRYSRDHR